MAVTDLERHVMVMSKSVRGPQHEPAQRADRGDTLAPQALPASMPSGPAHADGRSAAEAQQARRCATADSLTVLDIGFSEEQATMVAQSVLAVRHLMP
jgi:hypothetical protein